MRRGADPAGERGFPGKGCNEETEEMSVAVRLRGAGPRPQNPIEKNLGVHARQ